MNKTKLGMLLGITLLLTSCGGKSVDSSETTTSKPIISDKQTSEVISEPSSSVISIDSTTKETTSEKEIDYYSGWSNKLIELMQENLDGNILPYTSMGKGMKGEFIEESSDDSEHIIIYGGEFSTEKLEEFVEIYIACNWTVVSNKNQLIAKNSELDLRVIIANVDEFFTLTAYYEETFHPNNANAWTDEIIQAFNDYFHNHILPYTYLGTKYPTFKYDDSSSTLDIYGGTWDDQVISLANNAFLTSDGWNYDTSKEVGLTKLFMSKSFDSNCTIDVSLVKTSSQIASLKVVLYETWNPNIVNSWTNQILNYMNNNYHAVVPYIYLGRVAPKCEYTASSQTLKIIGSTYNEEVLTLSKTAFTSDNWTITSSDTDAEVVATKIYDKITLTATVSNVSNKCNMTIVGQETFNPNLVSAWPNSFDDYFLQFDNHQVPFFYMGAIEPSTSYYTNGKKLTIKGKVWDDSIYTLAHTALEKDTGWDTYNDEESLSFAAIKVFDDGCGFVIKFAKESGIPTLRVSYYENNTSSQSLTSWPSEIASKFNTYFINQNVPLAYLGSDDLSISSYAYNNQSLDITSDNTYHPSFFNKTKEMYQQDSEIKLSYKLTSDGVDMIAKKTDSNSNVIRERIYHAASNSNMKMMVQFDENYTRPTDGSWSNEIQAEMKDRFSNYVIPYIYLGTSYPVTEYKNNVLNIYGGMYNSQVITDFKNSFTDNDEITWSIKDETDQATATGTFISGDTEGASISIKLYKSNSTSRPLANLEISFSNGFDPSTFTGYSDTIKNYAKTNFNGHEIPEIYLGSKNPTGSQSNNANIYKITGSTFNGQILKLAETKLKSLGYEVSYDYKSYTASSSLVPSAKRLKAIKKFDDGSYMCVQVVNEYVSKNKSYNANMYIVYCPSITLDDTKTWDSTTIKYLGNLGISIPYFEFNYSGTLSSNYTSTDHQFSLYNKTSIDAKTNNAYLFKYCELLEAQGWKKDYIDPFSGFYYNETATTKLNSISYQNSAADYYYEDTSGCRYRAYFYVSNGSSNKVYLYVYNHGTYSESNETDWSSTMKQNFMDVFGINDIPYFYMVDNFSLKIDKQVSSGQITLTGKIYNEKIFTNFVNAINLDTNYTWSISKYYAITSGSIATTLTYRATGIKEDGSTLIMELSRFVKTKDEYPQLVITCM